MDQPEDIEIGYFENKSGKVFVSKEVIHQRIFNWRTI
jgi:hypothetical protein